MYVCVYFPHNDQLGSTDFPHNALSPQCIIWMYVCIFPSTTNYYAQIFPTMHFPHNVSLVRIGVCVCVCVQYVFTVTEDSDEIMFELSQKTNRQDNASIGFTVLKVSSLLYAV